ncbi:hypothetical protein [Roseomonas chloroacetimidivorans]|uniref:hypothetical protein n=1 Tax=Roseomonas chloroacetimidivorans TaxID=1766656 RepID=UPI003C72A31C
MTRPDPIKLHLLPDAPDADGLPRAGLVVPPGAKNPSRRPILLLFGSLAAALAEKSKMEGGQ